MNRPSIFILALTILALSSCQQEVPSNEPALATAEAPTEGFTLTNEQLELAGIELGRADSQIIAAVIHTSGRVEVPPQNLISIHSPIGGIVKNIGEHLLAGDYVRKGTRLATLVHPDLIHLQSQYVQAYTQLPFLEKEYERKQRLAATDATSQRELEKAESELRMTQATLQGMEAELRLLGFSISDLQEGNIRQGLSVYAPSSGYIAEVAVNEGVFATADQLLFEMIDPSHRHLELQVFAKDLPHIKDGQRIRWQMPADGTIHRGRVERVAKMIDPESKTGIVHGHFEQEPVSIAPGTFIHAEILTEEVRTLALPNAAILTEGEASFVFIREAGAFRKIPITAGFADTEYTAVRREDIPANAEVVLQGAYYLNGLAE